MFFFSVIGAIKMRYDDDDDDDIPLQCMWGAHLHFLGHSAQRWVYQ